MTVKEPHISFLADDSTLRQTGMELDVELFNNLRAKYFTNDEKRISLKKGGFLVRQDEVNTRLYFVLEGSLMGFLISDSGETQESFFSGKNMFVGVHSFFSKNHRVYANVIALEDSEVAYIEQSDLEMFGAEQYSCDFLSLVVQELFIRQRFAKNMMEEKEVALKKLYHSEKLSTLGEMAAGLAHELNNAIGVLRGNSEWIANMLNAYLQERESSAGFQDFQYGFSTAHTVSSQIVRKRKKEIERRFKASSHLAKHIAKLGYTDEKIEMLLMERNVEETVEQRLQLCELGTALKDMLIASEHATHVLQSIKHFNRVDHDRLPIDVNDTIRKTLSILKSILQPVELDLQLSALPNLMANSGELIQIWTNVIKNGCESMASAQTVHPKLTIVTECCDNEIMVRISDNGPGISPEIQAKIFQPNFTTKKSGISFGLGLGLSLVQRFIDSYNGTVSVQSRAGKTTFIIKIPIT